MERSLRLPLAAPPPSWARECAGTPTVAPLRPEPEPIVLGVLGDALRLRSVQIALGSAALAQALALAPPVTAVAVAITIAFVANTIAFAVAFAHGLAKAERILRKRAPLRIALLLLSDIPAWLAFESGGTWVQPGRIELPLAAWWGLVADGMLVVPVLATIADLLEWALRGRWTVRTRIAVIAAVCGLSGLLAGAYLLTGFETSEESWPFDLFVGVPALGACVVSATTAVALVAARRVLPESDPPSRESQQGARGEYRILRPIGAGGMGEVFLAQRVGPHGFQRPVVLKRITPESSRKKVAMLRFFEEARIAASLQHPNVVAVHDLGRLDEGWFLAMEYLQGASVWELGRLLAHRGVLTPSEAILAIGEQACRGLAHAHERGVIHRDVSPHNLMVTFEGVVKILDFGVAKVEGTPSPDGHAKPRREIRTQAGSLVGKLSYLAPEQFAGRPASVAGDLFALGVVLYELATDRHPYGRDAGEVPLGERAEDRIPLEIARPDLPDALCAAVNAALSFDPRGRPRDAAAMESALAAARSGGSRFDLGDWLRALAPGGSEAISVQVPAVSTATAAVPRAHSFAGP